MIQGWARANGWKTTVDDTKTVSVLVPATPGYEGAPAVCLQAHTDMVYVPADPSVIAQPIEIEIVDGFVQTVGRTRTLGADNGAGVALAMNAVNAPIHGPLELLFTANEEDTLGGAEGWNPETHGMVATRLINIDTPLFGKIAFTSAGFRYVEATLPIERETVAATNCHRISLTGYEGGHSGDHVHLNRGNAIKGMATLLEWLPNGWKLISISGGDAGNSIPAQAEAIVSIPEGAGDWKHALSELVHVASEIHHREITLTIEEVSDQHPLTLDVTMTIMNGLLCSPKEVVAWSPTIKGLPFLSTTLGLVRTTDSTVSFKQIVRGADEGKMEDFAKGLLGHYQKWGFTAGLGHHSGAWLESTDSPLMQSAWNAFLKIGVTPEFKGFHCGLELAALIGYPRRFEMATSIGAEVFDEHATSERMNVDSFEQTALVLEAILRDIAEGKV